MEKENEQQAQQEPPRNERRGLITALTIILSVILAVIIFMVVWYWGDSYPDLSEFRESIAIQGLDEGATPAGIEVFKPTAGNYSSEEMYFVAANMKDGTSRIYVTGKSHGYYGCVTLADENGEPFTEGINGIALDNYTMWVASGTTIYVDHSTSNNGVVNDIISKAIANEAYLNPAEDEDAEDAADDSADEEAEEEAEEYEMQSVEFTGSFAANCNADFIFLYYGTSTNYLYVGETRSSKDTTRQVATASGDTNSAIMLAYQESTGAAYGLVNLSDTYDADGNEVAAPKISSMYCIPDSITGAAVTDSAGTNELALIQSNGYVSSTMKVYDFSSSGVKKSSMTYANMYGSSFRFDGLYGKAGSAYTDGTIKVYTADSGYLDYEYTLPALAGELAVGSDDETIFVLFKSGASGYKALVRQIVRDVYKIDLPGKD
ncbi:MAG: hypothetical protein LUD51_05570 [Clostridia bacterium]|nr:hypothetical protein [Clostridia bacterium]